MWRRKDRLFQQMVLAHLFIFIEVQLIYNIVLVSGVQHTDSVPYIYMELNIYTFSDSFPL